MTKINKKSALIIFFTLFFCFISQKAHSSARKIAIGASVAGSGGLGILASSGLPHLGSIHDKLQVREQIDEIENRYRETQNEMSEIDKKALSRLYEEMKYIDLFGYNPKFNNLPAENDEITRVIYWHGFGDSGENHGDDITRYFTRDINPIKTITFNFSDATFFNADNLAQKIRSLQSFNIGGQPDATVGLLAMIECAKNNLPFWNVAHSRGGAALIQACHMVAYPEQYQNAWAKLKYPSPESRQEICHKIMQYHQQTFLANPLLNLRTIIEKINVSPTNENPSKKLSLWQSTWQSAKRGLGKVLSFASEAGLELGTQTKILFARQPISLLIDEHMRNFYIDVRQVDPELPVYKMSKGMNLVSAGMGDIVVTNAHDKELREIAENSNKTLKVGYGNINHGDITATLADFTYQATKKHQLDNIKIKQRKFFENVKEIKILSEDEHIFLENYIDETSRQVLKKYDTQFEKEAIANAQFKKNLASKENLNTEELRTFITNRMEKTYNYEYEVEYQAKKFCEQFTNANIVINEIKQIQKEQNEIENQIQSTGKNENSYEKARVTINLYNQLIENKKESLYSCFHLFKEGESKKDAQARIYNQHKEIQKQLDEIKEEKEEKEEEGEE